MQPRETAQVGGEPRSNGQVHLYPNAVVSERIDALVYGYLRRMGYNGAANEMDRESPFLGNSLTQSRGENRTIVTINDRVHDHTLEQIVQLFCQDGQFGVNHNLLEFGEELRRLTNRYTSLTSMNTPGRSQIHQQLYGRPAYSRHTQQNYSVRPAPQARAQMELQQISQIGEMRFRQEQQQAHYKQIQMQIQGHQMIRQQEQPKMDVLPPQTSCSLPASHSQQPPMQNEPNHQFEDVEFSHCSQSAEGSSRRKHNQPQNYKAKVLETVIDPLVGLINDQPWNDIENLHIEGHDAFFQNLDVIDKNFLAMYDYEQPSNGVEQIFEEMIASPRFENLDNMQFDADLIPVDEEVVIQTAMETKPVVYNIPNPSPLLSPLPKEMSFDRRTGEHSNMPPPERASSIVEDPNVSSRSISSKKREQADSFGDRTQWDEREKERERKSRRSVERSRSSRTDSPRRSSEEPKRRSDEKKKHQRDKERERDRDKSTNREREKRREQHVSASTSRHSSKHRPIVQSDRESTTSSSSRAPHSSSEADSSSRRDGDKEKRRREKEREDRRKNEISDKEKERSKPQTVMSSNFDSKQAEDLLSKVRKAHAAGSKSSDTRREVQVKESSSKRKADEMLSNKKDFKIPKKGSATMSKPDVKASYSTHSQSVPVIRETVSQSASTSKREKERIALSAELCEGEGRPDTTHFLSPRGHIARLSSMFVNIDKGYEAFQQGLRKNKKDAQVSNEDAVSDISLSPPDNAPGTSQASRPTRPMVAPRKGFLLNKSPSKTPSPEHSSSEETDKDSPEEYDDPFPQRSIPRNADSEPEPKKICREIDMNKATALLNRIHGLSD